GASAVVREAHIRIEFFADAGSSGRRRRLAQIGALLVALLFITIGVLSLPVVWDQYQYEETSPGIGVPQWWYSIWLPVFSALIAGRALQVFARKLRRDDDRTETAR
ncbi:MAG: TRAP transporter small permease, partial [Hydrogenophaga sp.]